MKVIAPFPPPRLIKPGLELSTPLFLLTKVLELMEGLATQITYQNRETPEMALHADLAHYPGGEPLFRLELVWDETEYSANTQRREIAFVIGARADATHMGSHITFRTSEPGEQPQLEMEVLELEITSRTQRLELARVLAHGFLQFINTGDVWGVTHLRNEVKEVCAVFKDFRD